MKVRGVPTERAAARAGRHAGWVFRSRDHEQPTYPQVGATRGELPAGYRHLRYEVVVGTGRPTFDRLGAAVLRLDLHRAAGFRVHPAGTPARVGLDLTWGVAWSPLRPRSRVVYVIDEPDRLGFAYGSLPGHPEDGEEAFLVTIDEAAVVRFRRVAFTRPGPWWARVLGPAIRLAQDRVTVRYLMAASTCAVR